MLRATAEALAKAQYSSSKDPHDPALLYAALGKKAVLQGLFRSTGNKKVRGAPGRGGRLWRLWGGGGAAGGPGERDRQGWRWPWEAGGRLVCVVCNWMGVGVPNPHGGGCPVGGEVLAADRLFMGGCDRGPVKGWVVAPASPCRP